MTLSSETPSPSGPTADPTGLPTNPSAYRKEKSGKGLSPLFWIVVVWSVLCVVAGVAVTKYLPKKLPKIDVPALLPQAHPVATVDTPPPVAITPVAPISAPSNSAEVAALSSRIERLEAGQRRTVAAAGAALAAASLVQAAQSSRPFTGELTAVETLLPDMADINALRRAAATGAPTRAALASEYPDAAARAAVAARAPAEGDSIVARALAALTAIVTVRRVDHVKGTGPDAVLARAETLVQDGDLEGALRELNRLPTGGKDSMAQWRAKAETRIEVDRRVANIRAAATRSLTQTMMGG